MLDTREDLLDMLMCNAPMRQYTMCLSCLLRAGLALIAGSQEKLSTEPTPEAEPFLEPSSGELRKLNMDKGPLTSDPAAKEIFALSAMEAGQMLLEDGIVSDKYAEEDSSDAESLREETPTLASLT